MNVNKKLLQNTVSASIKALLPSTIESVSELICGVHKQRLLSFLNSVSTDSMTFDDYLSELKDRDKSIMESILRHVLFSESEFKVTILSHIYLYHVKNKHMNYFHLALLNNLDSFSDYDFYNVKVINDNKKGMSSGGYYYAFNEDNREHYFTLEKLINIGCISSKGGNFGFASEKKRDFIEGFEFYITDNFEILLEYIKLSSQ